MILKAAALRAELLGLDTPQEREEACDDVLVIAGSEAEYVAQQQALGDEEAIKRIWG